MNFYELRITVRLLEDISYINVPYRIGVFINNSMLKSTILKEVHEKRFYKYVYDTLYPIERDRIYKKNKIYSIRLRGVNIQLLNKMAMAIYNHSYAGMKAIDAELNSVEVNKINKIYTLKPVIVTIDNKPWLGQNSNIDILAKQLNSNVEKKLNQIYGDDKYKNTPTFIESIEIKNKLPIKYLYKSISLLGNKMEIKIKQDDCSQMKGLITLALGLGEKGSSLGAGFCDYK